jgi:DNA-binding winged helix-turn-helix (wHTH) protein
MVARFATFTFDSDRRLLLDVQEQPIPVTMKAFEVLAVLIAAAPRVVTKVELHERVWAGTFVSDATLAGLVKELRRVLGDRDPRARLIRTSHGVGYAFGGVPLNHSRERGTPQHWIVVGGHHRVVLQAGENIIGRDPASVLLLDVRGVSRRHARIVIAGAEAQLEDLGSKNGTVLRGSPVTGPAALRDGDSILIADALLQYRVSDSGVSTETINRPV